MRIIMLLSVVLVTSKSVAQSKGSLEAVLADPSRVYEAGEDVFVDIILHVEAEEVSFVNLCTEGTGNLSAGFVLRTGDIAAWGECYRTFARADYTTEVWLGIGAGTCDRGRSLPIVGGRIGLGQAVFLVSQDEETPTTGEVRIGACNARPEHEAFCHVGDSVTNPIEVLLESAEPVTVKILRPPFIRGDANRDDEVDIADAIFIIQELFGTQNRGWPCLNAADANEDDSLNISDGIYLINFLFLGTAPPPWPFPEPGYDPDPTRPEVSGCETLS